MLIKFAETPDEIHQIAALNQRYQKAGLSADYIKEQGFVSWSYPVSLLEQMHALCPSVIAVKEGKVVAYALVAVREAASFHQELKLLLEKIEPLALNGKAIGDHSFYMMGQLCVDESCRGLALPDKMYAFHQEQLKDRYDYMITTISLQNTRSIRVHERSGFETIHEIHDHFGNWVVVVKEF
ncbi:MAG: hypothetical protein K2P88_10040 [Chitinophagaceae bacterium]|nr:hypothetical protein [Chitinophagaceae bacterium]